ncbi:uncharacterized protein TM35_000531130 [Trypanosoma theileri]|uniref:Mucin TcMUCII n=1 Tax=Trypanosoma theileri TaxID=67003 RepID=A0A1X0NIC2_9TRYP|nr:uncharacterized protein TM35_000531130 [Trypanosoma theileri]ORC83929.1 hypothetical protein TM35_000531130 [Trypanosoma theileri]
MMTMMRRVMCVLAVVLCCACGYTMAATAADSSVVSLAPIFMDWGNPDTSFASPPESTGKPTGTRGNTNDVTHSHGSGVVNEGVPNGRTEESVEELPPGGGPVTQVPGKDGELSKPQVSSDHSRGSEAGDVEHGASAVEGKGSSPLQSGVSRLPSTGTAGTHKEEEEVKQTQSQNNGTDPATHDTEEAPSNTSDNTTPADSNPNQPSPEAAGATAASDSQETTSTTQPSPESNVTEAPTTTPSSVPNSDINTIASTVKNKGNVDSSVSPVWMRTAAPLLIVAVFFSFTVY